MSYTHFLAYCDVLEHEYALLAVQAAGHRYTGKHGMCLDLSSLTCYASYP